MNTNLTVDDPLGNQEVTIIITLPTSTQSREKRPVLVSVGVAEQLPVIKTGVFGDVSALIQEAWTAFGVQLQLSEAVAGNGDESVADEVTADQEQILATADIEPIVSTQTSPPILPAPQPQAANLSLF